MSAYDNNQTEHGQDLNINAIVTTGLVFALLTIVAIMYLYGLYLRTVHAEQARVADGLSAEVSEMKNEQLQKINNTYGWVDPESGIAIVPIGDAIEDTVAEYRDMPTFAGATGEAAAPQPAADGEETDETAGGSGEDLAGRPGE